MKTLKMQNVLAEEAYTSLTAAERRHILKIEQAEEYSGFRQYPDTCSNILSFIPAEIIENSTAKQIGRLMQIISDAYNAGKNA